MVGVKYRCGVINLGGMHLQNNLSPCGDVGIIVGSIIL